MPSGPVLSEEDKEALRKRLEALCEASWTARGYKKTSVKALCEETGISIGTFYTLYPAKEDLFLASMERVRERLAEAFLDTVRRERAKEGFARAMKELFREYAEKPFLYNVNTPDFQSFAAKLPEGSMEKARFDSAAFFRRAVREAGLTLCVEEERAYGILSALLATVSARETLARTCDPFAVFDAMTDTLTASLFQ